jgi:hypothetical protein
MLTFQSPFCRSPSQRPRPSNPASAIHPPSILGVGEVSRSQTAPLPKVPGRRLPAGRSSTPGNSCKRLFPKPIKNQIGKPSLPTRSPAGSPSGQTNRHSSKRNPQFLVVLLDYPQSFNHPKQNPTRSPQLQQALEERLQVSRISVRSERQMECTCGTGLRQAELYRLAETVAIVLRKPDSSSNPDTWKPSPTRKPGSAAITPTTGVNITGIRLPCSSQAATC